MKRLLLLLSVSAGLAASLRADTGATGDLILAFVPDASVAQGQNTNLEVDLGNEFGYHYAAAGAPYQVVNLGQDLAATYGANWASTGLKWAVIGTTGSGASAVAGAPVNTVFVTANDGPAGAPSAPLYSGGDLTTAIYLINSATTAVSTTSNGLTDLVNQRNQVPATPTPFGNTQATNVVGSFNAEQGPNNFFLPGSVTPATLLTAVSASPITSADLEQLGSTGLATKVGWFTLDASTGILSFTVIPEPSAYAALIAAFSGIVAIRRRKTP